MLVKPFGLIILIFTQTFATWINETFIETINAKAKHWRAGSNHLVNFTEEELRGLANIRGYHSNSKYVFQIHKHNTLKLGPVPDFFDARLQWRNCKSISTIRDQGKCGASWAFAAVEVMSDRLCTASAGMVEFTFSPEELITCCTECGNGCDGGYIFPAFDYWRNIGVPSGGDEYSDLGCKPYLSWSGRTTSACIQECTDGYNKTWHDDLRHGQSAYRILKSEKQIQMEIMTYGPVVASMDVYSDFYVYERGVYEHVSWDLVGRIAVKIIGWGEENEIPYWLVANSWGEDYGENGYVKILRGSNHCGIEHEVTAGLPNTSTE